MTELLEHSPGIGDMLIPPDYGLRQEGKPNGILVNRYQGANDLGTYNAEDTERTSFTADNDEIIQRGDHHSPAEHQKGLTVFTAAIFIIGEMAGSGALALPYAVVGAGWTGFGLLVLCCLASGYCGAVLGRSWSILRDRHDEYKGHVRYPYPAIGEKAFGRWASVAVTVCIVITLIGE